MGYVAVFDIGTTSMKGVLLDEQAAFTGASSVELETHYGADGTVEQEPEDWWEGLLRITSRWWNEWKIDPGQVEMITFSGQMEDVIPISDASHRAILYSDTRAGEEAEEINEKFPDIQQVLGNTVRASSPVAKLLWMKRHHPELDQTFDQYVFSAKDYIIYKLANTAVTDRTTGSTTGMMNLETGQWETDYIVSLGIEARKLPELLSAEEVAGQVSREASLVSGFRENTPVLCGSGDAGASTMGAGAVSRGDAYVYMGTTGWAAMIRGNEDQEAKVEGAFQLAHIPEDAVISIAPLLNVGNVHQWGMQTFAGKEADSYAGFEEMVESSPAGANGLLFLPYLQGERCPVNDPDAKGAFWGVHPKTGPADFARAVMEGICFSFKQVVDSLNESTTGSITVIGGGTKSRTWCQILADCLGRPLSVREESEYMAALGAASSAFIKLGWADGYHDFCDKFMSNEDSMVYEPEEEHVRLYEEKYERYLQLYPGLRGVYVSS
ncbi:FGGY-family carbohydrate kinase [Virgibacillus xinjiangensis]|uniref:FGGY-family carbohydrate kinase n=1 Tax=Virgibacillus xinjiangensis TaxID=393090 RepID=A0ABV7CWR8_9BACI